MSWLVNHLWLVPLLITVFMAGLLVYFLITVKGEDIMAVPVVIIITGGISIAAWAVYGFYLFIRWVF